MTTLLPHQQQVVAERDELAARLDKLSNFLESKNFEEVVPNKYERVRLCLQETHMRGYLDVLNARIANF